MKKKVFVDGYFKNNLGDDLFLKILIERYPHVTFIVLAEKRKYKYFQSYNNLKIIDTGNKILNYIYNRLLKKGKNFYDTIRNILCYYANESVMIGGSIFMEDKENADLLRRKYEGKKFYILGANIGPLFTERYLKVLREIFENSKDVCVRDLESYRLVKDIPKVRYAPDIVFGLKIDEKYNDKNKQVFLSVINPANRGFTEEQILFYQQILEEKINHYHAKQFRIVAASFCTKERDDIFLLNLKKQYPYLEIYLYSNNIDEVLNIMHQSSIIIATRYHAMILGFLMKKIVIPVAYSDKMVNVLKDLDYNYSYYNILEKSMIESKNNMEYGIICIDDVIKKSEKQFEHLDYCLNI